MIRGKETNPRRPVQFQTTELGKAYIWENIEFGIDFDKMSWSTPPSNVQIGNIHVCVYIYIYIKT
jgi:hypothetical protein